MNIKELLKSNMLKFLAGGFVVGVFCLAFTQLMLHATGTKTFCSVCHSMQHEAETFAVSSHRELDCIECHLPHDNTAHYLIEKGRTGMVDMYHELLRDYPARIKLTADSRQMINDNCVRCHNSTMSYVTFDEGKQGNSDCLKCHSRIAHGSNHLEGGIEIE